MTTTKLSPLAFIGRLLKLSQRQAVCSSSSSSHDSKDGEEEFHPTLEPGTEPNISHLCEKNADLDVLPGDFAIMDKHHMDYRHHEPAGYKNTTVLFTQNDILSPVYDGVARKLGYKTRRGFQKMA